MLQVEYLGSWGPEIVDFFKLGNLTNQRTSQIHAHVGQRNQFWLAADYCIRSKLSWESEKKNIFPFFRSFLPLTSKSDQGKSFFVQICVK